MFMSLFFIVILLVILTFVWPPDSPWSPWWRTNKIVATKACKLADISKKDTVYELGSGDGEFILTAATEFHSKKAIGIEIDHTRFLIASLKKRIRGVDNAFFIRKDFKQVNLSGANVVYLYLVPAVIERILPKLKKELKPGTRVISYRYKMPLPNGKKVDELYLYKI